MRPPAEIVWCGVSAPVVQGLFVGLGIAAVGLMAFPFAFTLVRPSSGRLADFGRAAVLIKWGTRSAWLASPLDCPSHWRGMSACIQPPAGDSAPPG